MLPLIPLILGLAPQVARWIGGDPASDVTTRAIDIVRTAVGSDDPETVKEALARDPAMAAQLQISLAQLAADRERAAQQAELDKLRAHLEDVKDARGQTVALAKTKSSAVWGAPVVSLVIVGAFVTLCFVILNKSIPEGSDAIANVLMGSMAAMATQVANYWLGSSVGSADKTAALANSMPIPAK